MAKKKFDLTKAVTNVAGLAGGAVASRFVGTLPVIKNLDPVIQGIAKIGIGIGLPILAPKMEILQSVGNGMIAIGGVELASKFIPQLAGVSLTGLGAIGQGTDLLLDGEFFDTQELGAIGQQEEFALAGPGDNGVQL